VTLSSPGEASNARPGAPAGAGEEVFVFPVSFAQERLWFLDQFEPASPFYNIPAALPLSGRLDLAALRRALDLISERHESLRTTFATLDQRPAQVVHPALRPELSVTDLRTLPEGERRAAAARLATEEAQRPFDLRRGPLLRARLLRLGGEPGAVLLLTMHHIISDGWSMGILFRELGQLYEAGRGGRPARLPELAVQYADFAQWQRLRLRGAYLEGLLGYWRRRLEGAPPVLGLPTDRPRPKVQGFRGATRVFGLGAEVAAGLKALSQREGVTLFMTLLAAFKVLLWRWSGEEDVVVGSPIAGRTRAEVEGLIGFFVNTLVLRTDLSGGPSYRELVGRVREVTLGAYEHQEVPFERLVEELQPHRSLSHNPLFQVMFTLQNTPTYDAPGLSQPTLEALKNSPQLGTSRFDLALFTQETAEGVLAGFEYNTDLFEAATIDRMVGHFQTLLAAVIANPGARISELPLLTGPERRQLLRELNDTASELPPHLCVPQSVEAQVERTPGAAAVVMEGRSWTYEEVNRRANQVAHYLRGMGVGPEARVCLYLERSLEMLVGMLGVLKAGAAYVPLDPNYPQERITFIVSDVRAGVVITERRMAAGLVIGDARLCCLDADAEALARQSVHNPPHVVAPDNLAYVIYTSGSTGRPKGVGMTHRALVNLLQWHQRNLPLAEGSRVLQFASQSFDVSIQEILSTWVAGGTLVLTSEETRRDARRLLQEVTRYDVERLFLPQIVLQQLAEAARDAAPPVCVREIITAGEQLHLTGPVVGLLKRLEGCAVRNHYGPSESHVVTEFVLRGDPEEWPALPPIGRPIANTRVYLLDPHLQPVPVGIPGELYIGGAPLARGYVGRPGLTAERFVPDPFGDEPGGRLYRTGDSARFLPGGDIEFLGRLDYQVKLRGFRIELGEVEAALAQHPAVKEAVVVLQQPPAGDKRLVAYFVADGPAPLTTELYRFLKSQLPEYMIPAVFVQLDALPLSANGKVDRRALPGPDQQRPELERAFTPPRTPTEQALAKIWSEVLGVERVGVYDNFFELGGHSLLATQVVSRVRAAIQMELPLRSLFESPTIAELAVTILCSRAEETDDEYLLQVLAELDNLSVDEARARLDGEP